MVQIIPANPRPSVREQIGERIAEGLGRGLESGMVQGANLTLQQKMNALEDKRKIDQAQAMYEKEQERIAPYIKTMEKAFPGYTATYHTIGPEATGKLLQEYGPTGFRKLLAQVAPQQQMAEPQQMQALAQGNPSQAGNQIGMPSLAGLAKDTAQAKNMLLRPQYREAEEPRMAPSEQMMPRPQQVIPQAVNAAPRAQEIKSSEVKPLQEMEAELKQSDEYNDVGPKQQKELMARLRARHHAMIEDAKLDLANKKAERELQELPKSVSDKLSKLEDVATRADQSINAVENIDSLLAQGAQMPKLIQELNLKLGSDNPVAKFASNLMASDLSKAVETARVQQFTGMKDIFGGQIRIAEFNEFIKKLQDVKDPEVSNKLKSVLLKQFANMEKFPYEGLTRAAEENRAAPSDVILRKGKQYADQMTKEYTKKSKAEMDKIIQESKTQEEKEKGYIRMMSPQGIPGKVRREDLKQAMSKGYKKQ